MSITKSYNKRTGIYYAYETTYEWSEEKQKKVQKKRCIGQFDPYTGEVIPNGKVGRPSLKNATIKPTAKTIENTPQIQSSDIENISSRIKKLENTLRLLADEANDIAMFLAKLKD